MKKNILFAMVLMLSAVVLTGCDKDSEGLSHITYYPSLSINGSSIMAVPMGGSFQEPGYAADLNGEDVTGDVQVTGAVNTAQKGSYTLTYSIKNSDGISAKASRTVVVYDANSKYDGLYMVASNSYRVASATAAYGRQFPITVTDNGNGTATVSDLLGGWYEQRAGYGAKYAAVGTISVAADGTLGLVNSSVAGWGDGLDDLQGTLDAATGNFDLVSVYAGMEFHQTWVRQQ